MSDDELNPLDELDIGDEDTDFSRGYARGFTEGRRQVLLALRDDTLYHEWNRRWGLDPGGPRSYVLPEQRDVMHDFVEWATSDGGPDARWAARIAEGNTAT